MKKAEKYQAGHARIKWLLVPYDFILFFVYTFTVSVRWGFDNSSALKDSLLFVFSFFILETAVRILLGVYSQVWRFGGIQSYIRILVSDGISYILSIGAYALVRLLKLSFLPSSFNVIFITAVCGINCLLALAIRMFYRYAYKCGGRHDFIGKILRFMLKTFAGKETCACFEDNLSEKVIDHRAVIAIVGAGTVGAALAQDLLSSKMSGYKTDCFIDTDKSMVNRQIFSLPVFDVSVADPDFLRNRGVQQLVFAAPHLSDDVIKALYEKYREAGFTVKSYDYPTIENASSSKRRSIREFDIAELLFRRQRSLDNGFTSDFYKGKTVLVTGGGGSIGSELARQLAKMHPARLIVLDVYENGAYDLQQELKIAYGKDININLEILSVCNMAALERVFAKYKPDIVIHAAAHKHVPLMENNCVEAVENNIFGTYNTVELSEKYGAEHFIMVSTDKAVNPTNVMGATKRFCEMIVMNRATRGSRTVFSATRFGNVLGSAGSVIPLFKRQISAGGPITLTDMRIIRYFMTIPEASQLVLESGAMAKNGELFVLDMGKPVKILDLAENMIRLSGLRPYEDIDIIETGLRPGEKLYEELLIKSDTLTKTDNNMIFVEKDTPVSDVQLAQKLEMLRAAVATGSDDEVRRVLHETVPTFRTPAEVNAEADGVLGDK